MLRLRILDGRAGVIFVSRIEKLPMLSA